MLQTLISLDEQLFVFFHNWARGLPEFWKALAIYGVYIIPVFLVWFWFARRRDTALFAALTGIVAWLGVNNIISRLVPRERPIPFIDLNFPAKEFLFDRPGGSFPSDHTSFLVALTTIFWLSGERKVAQFLLILTILTMLSRIVTAQHWPGDILVGAIVGCSSAWVVWQFRKPIEQSIIAPIIGFVRRIGL